MLGRRPSLTDPHPQFAMEGSHLLYYTRLRPGLAAFLEAMAPLYEMHVYTMGTRKYALEILRCTLPGAVRGCLAPLG